MICNSLVGANLRLLCNLQRQLTNRSVTLKFFIRSLLLYSLVISMVNNGFFLNNSNLIEIKEQSHTKINFYFTLPINFVIIFDVRKTNTRKLKSAISDIHDRYKL